MTRNIHIADRLIRVIIAEILILSAYFLLSHDFAMVAYIAAGLFLLGALTGLSYFYTLLDISTKEYFKDKIGKPVEGMLIYAILFVGLIPLYLRKGYLDIQDDLLIATGIGFLAQTINGALGMGYGTLSTVFLISIGIPPIASSASVHTSEIFTSGMGGLAHLKAGNVDKHVLKYLILPGVFGALIGAYLLKSIPSHFISPFIALYLFAMGLLIIEKTFETKPMLIKAFSWIKHGLKMEHGEKWGHKLAPFGILGGALDAIGGGGWGQILTLTLFFKGENLRQAIGSVNFTEFFVTLSVSAVLLSQLRLEYWQIIVGLIIGGLLSVPIGPYLTKKLPYKPLMLVIGVLIIVLSLRTMIGFFLSLF